MNNHSSNPHNHPPHSSANASEHLRLYSITEGCAGRRSRDRRGVAPEARRIDARKSRTWLDETSSLPTSAPMGDVRDTPQDQPPTTIGGSHAPHLENPPDPPSALKDARP